MSNTTLGTPEGGDGNGHGRMAKAIDSALAVRGARLAVILFVPFLSGAGWIGATYFEHQSKTLDTLVHGQQAGHDELNKAKIEVQQSVNGVASSVQDLKGTVGVVSNKVDDLNRRVDAQGQYMQKQGNDIDELKKLVYPLSRPVPPPPR